VVHGFPSARPPVYVLVFYAAREVRGKSSLRHADGLSAAAITASTTSSWSRRNRRGPVLHAGAAAAVNIPRVLYVIRRGVGVAGRIQHHSARGKDSGVGSGRAHQDKSRG